MFACVIGFFCESPSRHLEMFCTPEKPSVVECPVAWSIGKMRKQTNPTCVHKINARVLTLSVHFPTNMHTWALVPTKSMRWSGREVCVSDGKFVWIFPWRDWGKVFRDWEAVELRNVVELNWCKPTSNECRVDHQSPLLMPPKPNRWLWFL